MPGFMLCRKDHKQQTICAVSTSITTLEKLIPTDQIYFIEKIETIMVLPYKSKDIVYKHNFDLEKESDRLFATYSWPLNDDLIHQLIILECEEEDFEDYMESIIEDEEFTKVLKKFSLDKFYENGIIKQDYEIPKTTKVYALVGGNEQEEIMFAVSKNQDVLKEMLAFDSRFYIKEVGLWVLSRVIREKQPKELSRSDLCFVHFNKVEEWRLEDKLVCYTRINKKYDNILLRVGHVFKESSPRYQAYVEKVKRIYDISNNIKLDTFYPDGMMNA